MSNDAQAPQFTDSDIVGAIQRMMMELSGYLNQPVSAIDPNLVMQMINRMAYFTSLLGNVAGAPHGMARGAEGGAEAMAN